MHGRRFMGKRLTQPVLTRKENATDLKPCSVKRAALAHGKTKQRGRKRDLLDTCVHSICGRDYRRLLEKLLNIGAAGNSGAFLIPCASSINSFELTRREPTALNILVRPTICHLGHGERSGKRALPIYVYYLVNILKDNCISLYCARCKNRH